MSIGNYTASESESDASSPKDGAGTPHIAIVKIGVAGAAAILIALPKHIEELGMVGCDLDDRTGSHLIKFIKQSKYLKMVCVEENNFSQKMRAKIKNLRKQQSKCTIIV